MLNNQTITFDTPTISINECESMEINFFHTLYKTKLRLDLLNYSDTISNFTLNQLSGASVNKTLSFRNKLIVALNHQTKSTCSYPIKQVSISNSYNFMDNLQVNVQKFNRKLVNPYQLNYIANNNLYLTQILLNPTPTLNITKQER